jgi:dimeric dUTPase (all-alpha-NTP-PPase superfamily)
VDSELITDRLSRMFQMQTDLQQVMPPVREFPSPDPNELMSQIRGSALALIAELVEMLDETGWKPWAASNHINRDAYRGEIIDMWHFFMNLCILGGVSPSDLYDGYIRKHNVNRERQENGYDGVSTKCPGCKRALDDPAVKCCYAKPLKTKNNALVVFCLRYGWVNVETGKPHPEPVVFDTETAIG